MRNFLICFLLISLLSSCNDDDENDLSAVVGSYNVTLFQFTDCPNAEDEFQYDFTDADCVTAITMGIAIEVCTSGTLDLADNGTFTSSLFLIFPAIGESIPNFSEDSGTYSLNGSVLTICSPECEDFMVEGNTLTQMESVQGCNGDLVLTKL